MNRQQNSSIVIAALILAKILAKILAVILATVSARACFAEAPPGQVFSVTQYGAVGDGTALDTAAIQQAVDACHAAGGGTVLFPPGIFLSGTVFLKDNVRLFLDTQAVLRGSPRPQDYPAIPRQNALGAPAFKTGFLLYGEGLQRVAIEGRGTIDGQGPAFWLDEMINAHVRKPLPSRPRALVCLVQSNSLLVRDVSLVNSPCYTLWLIGCDDVNIDGIVIRNPHDGPNTDGIDIDCCSRVRIANCLIDGGDDAIAIKSDGGLLGADKPCEDITVTNCVLCSVPACGVRIGYEGDSIIRNCTFSNLTIYDTDIGLDIISILPDVPRIQKGSRCEHIVFNNITMRNVNRALFFWMGNETDNEAQVYLKNVLVSNIVADCRIGCFVGGYADRNVENVTISNLHLTLTGDMPEQARLAGSQIWGGSWNPYAMYCTKVDGLRVESLDVDWTQSQGHWRHTVYCEDVSRAALTGITSRGFCALPGVAQIGLKNSSARIYNCLAETGDAPFLQLTDRSRAFVSGCDLTEAKDPFSADATSSVVEGGR
ncbi:MAG: glycoside hydrolase family 28 protein [Planctomycetaceae bacterium]|nr:glycoside hydrolase family 28 protein [Planctomycetaceae bacterium]